MKKIRVCYDDAGAIRDQYLCVRTQGTIIAESLLRKMTFRTVKLKTGEEQKRMLLPPGRTDQP